MPLLNQTSILSKEGFILKNGSLPRQAEGLILKDEWFIRQNERFILLEHCAHLSTQTEIFQARAETVKKSTVEGPD